MERKDLFCLLFLCLALSWTCNGSMITLASHPSIIKEGLTESLVLRCSVELRHSFSACLTSQPEVGAWPNNEDPPIFDNIQQLLTNVYNKTHHTIGLFNPVDLSSSTMVARIISSEEAKLYADSQAANITSNLTPQVPANDAYLEVVWEKPGINQSGVYTCEINALDSIGHGFQLKSDLEIKYLVPEVQELITRLDELKAKTEKLEEKTDLLKFLHFESGAFSCGNDDTWIGDAASKTKYGSVVFENSYTSPPLVTISPGHMDVDAGANVRYQIGANTVTTTGFNVTCFKWANTKFYGMTIYWYSIGY